ncbi:MAG TPA: hypothetical protein DDW52_12920 [Planctomycetaceae bacterium]|nr:hypothetical protein [Planctomycetaceae bacterium]
MNWITHCAACVIGLVALGTFTFAQSAVSDSASLPPQAVVDASRCVVAVGRLPRSSWPRSRMQAWQNTVLGKSGRGQSSSLRTENGDRQSEKKSLVRVGQRDITFFGNGVVIAERGLVVTCAHVLGDPREHDYFVCSRDAGGTSVTRRANLLGSDPYSDIAVLEVPELPAPSLRYRAGPTAVKTRVWAVGGTQQIDAGSSLVVVESSVSGLRKAGPGVVADNEAQQTIHAFGTLIEVPAAAQLSNSGGALLSAKGELVGLTTSLVKRGSEGRAAGYCIAADALFQRVVQSLSSGVLPEYGFLGIQPNNLLPQDRQIGHRGAVVSSVLPGMPGEAAGLTAGDVIVSINSEPIDSRDELFRELSRIDAKGQVFLTVERLGRPGVTRRLSARLGKKPATSPRLAYAISAPKPWRGMMVDYITALPPERLLADFGSVARRASIAVVDVRQGSQAWDAGIRPGDALISAAGVQFDSPEKLRDAIGKISGEVAMELIRPDGVVVPVRVSEPSDAGSER